MEISRRNFVVGAGADATDAASISASVSSSDWPCFSQNAGPMPRISSSSSTLRGAARSTSSSTVFAATVNAYIWVLLEA